MLKQASNHYLSEENAQACFVLQNVPFLAPRYLFNLIPSQVENVTTYNLRTHLTSETFLAQHSSCQNTPSTINIWNSFTDEVRSAQPLNSFKSLLSRGRKKIPLFYYDSQMCIYHSRLRTCCSNLNEHLFSKT